LKAIRIKKFLTQGTQMFSFRKKIIGKNNKKIIFLLCGWPGKIWHYYLTAKILEINGFQSIIYEYDKNILSSSIKDTIEKNGKVLIPELGLGRAQETMLIIEDAIKSGKLKKIPIYIGKALNIRSRLQNHLADKFSPKERAIAREAVYIKFQETNSEFEALVLEASLVKKYLPKYNSALRDDKSPIYILSI